MVVKSSTDECSESKSEIGNEHEKSYNNIQENKTKVEVMLPGKRKTQEQMKILIEYYHLYEGHWDEKNFRSLIQKTGFNKKQLNKWFWDRKKKE